MGACASELGADAATHRQCSARSPWPRASAHPAAVSARTGSRATWSGSNRLSRRSRSLARPAASATGTWLQTSSAAARMSPAASACPTAPSKSPASRCHALAHRCSRGRASGVVRRSSARSASATSRWQRNRSSRRSTGTSSPACASSASWAAEPLRSSRASHSGALRTSTTDVRRRKLRSSAGRSENSSSRTYSATSRSAPANRARPVWPPRSPRKSAASDTATGQPSVRCITVSRCSRSSWWPVARSIADASGRVNASWRGPSSTISRCARMRATGSAGRCRVARASVACAGRSRAIAASAFAAGALRSRCASSSTSTNGAAPSSPTAASTAAATAARSQIPSSPAASGVTHANGRASCSDHSRSSVVLP